MATTINTATSTEIPQIIDTIAMAFAADPFVRWIYPDPNQYLSNIREMLIRFGGKAFDHGTAYYVDGFVGAALWLPPDIHPDEEALGEHMQRTISESILEDAFSVLEQMEHCHPTDPHWYLPLLAVDPVHQGNGYGSALLKDAIAKFDTDGMIAYLESSNPRNISLYERHGFEIITEIQAGTTPVTPMVRKPR
jgi:ribosomal protein S18 acetylase RimI-like enzyme